MDKAKFNAVFPIIIASLADEIMDKSNMPENKAIEELYTSQLYSALENEETKAWQYSTEKLYDLYRMEKENGRMELPEY